MPTDERSFRSELAKQLRKDGHQVVVTVGDFNKGLPDLYIKLDDRRIPGVWVELKWFGNWSKPHKIRQIPLTALQASWILEHWKRGGLAFYVVGWKDGPVTWGMAIGANINPDLLTCSNLDLTHQVYRTRGRPWELDFLIMQALRPILNLTS